MGQYCVVQIDDEWLEWFLLSVLCTKPSVFLTVSWLLSGEWLAGKE
ncbi:hypothetical protein KZ770_05855 [Escherichia coli]|nr:hypothetical protein [Escherichia coli]